MKDKKEDKITPGGNEKVPKRQKKLSASLSCPVTLCGQQLTFLPFTIEQQL